MENNANLPADLALSISTAPVADPSPSAVIATLSQSFAHSTGLTLTTSVQDPIVGDSKGISEEALRNTVQTIFSNSTSVPSTTIIPQDSSMESVTGTQGKGSHAATTH